MRISFSRKGFDSAAGGVPSPILDGRPVSLPIPANGTLSVTRYGDLQGDYATLVTDLTRGRLTGADYCHCDPDLIAGLLPRQAGWRGALGTDKIALSHLRNQQFGSGDLFLFFGLFQSVMRSRAGYVFDGPREHRLWGWLQVGEVIDLGPDGSHAIRQYPWLAAHPHTRAGWQHPNGIFLATPRLSLPGLTHLPGWGTFATGLPLTAPGAQVSTWQVPTWLHSGQGGTGLTYHDQASRWEPHGRLRVAGRGQEFVADVGERSDVLDWLRWLFATVHPVIP